jgi:hypothetical protein
MLRRIFMTSRDQFKRIKNGIFAGLLTGILFCVLALPAPVYAKDVPNQIPSLNTFIETVENGNASTLRGVYVPDVMALLVVQQPAGQPGFVSSEESVVTQFSMAKDAGNIGLLAHNTHAGKFFPKIKQGDQVILVYGDGHTENFTVNNIKQYQALDPLNPYGKFKDLETQTISTAEGLFNKVYRGKYHLTLQTCIDNNGNPSWGRLFIVANPTKD